MSESKSFSQEYLGNRGYQDIHPIAVIDIGSNSVRMVAYAELKRTPIPIFNEKVLCGLGYELSKTGHLNSVGRTMAIATLSRFNTLARAMGVGKLFAVATAAVREAADGLMFLEELQQKAGIRARILSGREEAWYSGLGVLSAEPNGTGLVGDFGGGSLELVSISDGKVGESMTLPLGALSLSDFDTPELISEEIDSHLENVSRLTELKGQNLYVVGGAWRAIGRLHMKQNNHPLRILHGYSLPADDIVTFCSLLTRLGSETLSQLSGISKGRLSTLPVAALALRSLVERTKVDRTVFSAFGLREGIVYDALGAHLRKDDPLISACRSISSMSPRFGIDENVLLSWLDPMFENEPSSYRRLRCAAGLLSDIGWRVHPDYRGEHAVSEILRAPIVGVNHSERVRLALAVCARYSHEDAEHIRESYNSLIDKKDFLWATQVGLGLRLAHTLSGGISDVLRYFSVEVSSSRLTLTCLPGGPESVDEMITNRLTQLATTLGKEAAYCSPK